MNNELYHHGIKGQRWGIRRTKAQLAKLNNSDPDYYDKYEKGTAKLDKHRNIASNKLDKLQKRSGPLEKEYNKAVTKYDVKASKYDIKAAKKKDKLFKKTWDDEKRTKLEMKAAKYEYKSAEIKKQSAKAKAKFYKNKQMQDAWNKNIKDIDGFYDNVAKNAEKRFSKELKNEKERSIFKNQIKASYTPEEALAWTVYNRHHDTKSKKEYNQWEKEYLETRKKYKMTGDRGLY